MTAHGDVQPTRLRPVAFRRAADGAMICADQCASGESVPQAAIYDRTRVDEPERCIECRHSIALRPTEAGLFRHLSAWVNHEAQTGLDVGAAAAYATYAATALRAAFNVEWWNYVATASAQLEPVVARQREHGDTEALGLALAVASELAAEQCDLSFFVLRRGRWAVAREDAAPRGWTTKAPLRLGAASIDDDKGRPTILADAFAHSFRGRDLYTELFPYPHRVEPLIELPVTTEMRTRGADPLEQTVHLVILKTPLAIEQFYRPPASLSPRGAVVDIAARRVGWLADDGDGITL